MAKTIKSLRGFNDILPADTHMWREVASTIQGVFDSYHFSEIKTSFLEPTELFARGVGEATDIVEKEMFTFALKGDDNLSVTLRPEGTAGTIRACIENGLTYNQEQRIYYFGPNFRYERPQKGRYRQFNQFGVEVLGIKNPALDAEVLVMLSQLWEKLGIAEHVNLEINTIGASADRAAFGKALVAYLEPLKEQLDEDSQRRLTSNPMRILDSKDAKTQELLVNAPRLEDFINEESKAYFAEVLELLTACGVNYKVNNSLVRGLDYYNDIVFEWTTDKLGAQATVCGGGRYDGLVELLGGKACPGFGFGIGFERLVLLIEEIKGKITAPNPDVFVIYDNAAEGLQVASLLRKEAPQLRVQVNTAGGKLKKQFAKADKVGAKVTLLVFPTEFAQGQVVVKNLANGEQETVALPEVAAKITSLLA